MGQTNQDTRGQKFKKGKKDEGGRSTLHNASGDSGTEKQANSGSWEPTTNFSAQGREPAWPIPWEGCGLLF